MVAKQFPGIEVRHRQACASRSGGPCNCQKGYRAVVYDRAAGRRRNGPWGPSLAEARSWRIDAQSKLKRGALSGMPGLTLRAVADKWLEEAATGRIRSSSGKTYKPSTLRSYRSSLQLHVLEPLGGVKIGQLRRRDVQGLVDRLSATLDGSTVRNAIMPLRVICRYGLVRDLVAVSPCEGLELPAASGRRFAFTEEGTKREQIATVEEADELIAALPTLSDQAIWATAFYTGLRRGELRGLFRDDVDLESKVIHVRRGWDMREGEIDTKTDTSKRDLPILRKLTDVLDPYFAGHDGREFSFPGYGRWGRDYGPFSADALLKRCRRTWIAAGLEPIGLHEARHTFASLMIDAGLPIAKVSRRMGHSSISVTERTYYWLLPEAYEEERDTMNAYLERQHASP